MNVRVTIVTIADPCPATSQMEDLPDPSLRRLPAPGAWTFRQLDRATAHSGGSTSRVDRTASAFVLTPVERSRIRSSLFDCPHHEQKSNDERSIEIPKAVDHDKRNHQETQLAHLPSPSSYCLRPCRGPAEDGPSPTFESHGQRS